MFKEIPKDQIAFVILSGFARDNHDVVPLQKKLLSLGYYAIALPFWGDIKIDDLSTLTTRQSKEGVFAIISLLKEKYKIVIGIGISLGGAFLIEHAKENNNLDYIVSVGTPFKLKNRRIINLGFKLLPFILWFEEILKSIGMKRVLPPVDMSKMVIDFMEGDFLLNLEKVETPLLLLHSRQDAVAYVSALPFFMDKIKSKQKNVIYFNNIGHVFGYDDKLIGKLIVDFLTERNSD